MTKERIDAEILKSDFCKGRTIVGIDSAAVKWPKALPVEIRQKEFIDPIMAWAMEKGAKSHGYEVTHHGQPVCECKSFQDLINQVEPIFN